MIPQWYHLPFNRSRSHVAKTGLILEMEKNIMKEPSGREFTCLATGRRFIRTGEIRLPLYKEYYEIYPGACITSQATRKYRAGSGFMIVRPLHPGQPIAMLN